MNQCYCCGYDICLDMHHPDGKKKFIIVRDLKEGIVYEYEYSREKEDEVRKTFFEKKKKGGVFNIHYSKLHINPDNWIWVCPNCHRLIHSKKYGVNDIEKLKKYHEIAKEKGITLNTQLIMELNNSGN